MTRPAAKLVQETIAQTMYGVQALVPELLLLLGFLLVLLLDLLPFCRLRKWLAFFTFLVLLTCFGWQVGQGAGLLTYQTGALFQGMLVQDGLALWGSLLFSSAALLSILILWFGKTKGLEPITTNSEFYAVLLAVVLGLNLLVRSSNLLMLFLSLEVVSVGSYLLVLLRRIHAKRVEAGLKYILYGVFASGIMLYGLSFLYGLTGTLQFQEPVFWQNLQKVPELLLGVVWGLILAGLLFKLAGFPFQFWAPDVYEAAPTGVVAFFSAAPKMAAVLVLYRLFQPIGSTEWLAHQPYLLLLLQVLTAVTLMVGNFTALQQKDGKRLMAYSSVAQAGFMLLLLISHQPEAGRNLLFYGSTLLLANMGVFMVMQLLENATGSGEVAAWAGLGRKAPIAGVPVLVLLVSLTGLPPTMGFMAKLLVFTQLWQAYSLTADPVWLWLLIGAVLFTAVALYYYFRIIYFLFFKGHETQQKLVFPLEAYVFLAVLCTAVLFFFFKADWLLDSIEHVLSLPNFV